MEIVLTETTKQVGGLKRRESSAGV